MRGVPERPAGLVYHPDLLDDAQEQALVGAVERYDFQQVVMHGQPARRTVRHFGFGYDYDSARAVPGDPLPPELLELRERCAALAGVPAGGLAEALVTRYPPGATRRTTGCAPAVPSRSSCGGPRRARCSAPGVSRTARVRWSRGR